MAKKSFWQRGDDYAEKVSEELIEQIKAGVAPWQKPWKPGEQSSPENFSTGKSYTGGNSLYLMSRGIRQGHGDNRWGTYGQIQAAGGQVRKGEKGTQVLFFTDRTARTAKDEQGKVLKDKDGNTIHEEEQRAHPICKQYTVFNVEQADGLELKPRSAQARPEWDAHRDAEKVIEASGPRVEHVAGDRAYYRIAEDKVVLPEPSQFPTRNGYYQTALHECGHSARTTAPEGEGEAEADETRDPSNSEGEAMQAWKISVGLTAIILAVALMLAGESFAYLKPYLGIIATDYWLPVAWHGGLAVVTLMVVIYSAARALGLADMGLKVDLMERSIRRGEGGQIELAEKLEQEDRGQFPGA